VPEYAPHDVSLPQPKKSPVYYIDVSPRLELQGSLLPLDAISMISCLSKFMGKHPEDWDRHLFGISERGYNMIHFTPLTIRGESNSPYSIYDQLRFDQELFPGGEGDVETLVSRMHDEFGLLALTDVVWNHTANNSKWLEDHPEGGYSVKTAPWLESALKLDDSLLEFGASLDSLGYSTEIKSTADLDLIIEGVKTHCIEKLRLWEYYTIDIDRETQAILSAWRESHVEFPDEVNAFGDRGLSDTDAIRDWPLKRKAEFLIEKCMTGLDRLGERFRRRCIVPKAAAFLSVLVGRYDTRTLDSPDEAKADKICRQVLNELNLQFYKEYDMDAATICEQLKNLIKWSRLDEKGPNMGPITSSSPLVQSYFTRLPHNTKTKRHDPKSLALVNNGWVWAADAMKDNAGPTSKAYLKREVIVWGDCVKLRYGDGPEDNPWLWKHIAKYTRLMAKIFDGFRIDNCHSTPIHLAEYMLDQARQVHPNLIVVAELFSGSEEMDFVFVKRLGLNCLVREAMQAWSTKELSRLVHMHAGIPIGSFETDEITSIDVSGNGGSGLKEVIRTIQKSPVHALFMDCTHDNQTPVQKREGRDTLPNAALVAMCACATGSVFGYDEVYPFLIELVTESRPYTSLYSNKSEIKVHAGEGGIGPIKKLLNQIHVLMGKDGYTECFIHHDNEYITVQRVHPKSRKGYFLIAHTAFPGYGNGNGGFGATKLPGTRAKCIGSWVLEVDDSDEAKKAAKDDNVLRGIPSRTKDIRGVSCEFVDGQTVIQIPNKFPPGSIAIFETWIPGAEHSEGLDTYCSHGATEACKNLKLSDLNMLLYRCDPEERDCSGGKDGTYIVPNHGQLVYAGLQGWMSCLRDIICENNLGHPLCDHLRSGYWPLDYIVNRLERASLEQRWKALREPAVWLRDRFKACRKLPNFLVPRYFAICVQTMYNAGVGRVLELLSSEIRGGNSFVQNLALVSVQVTGVMNSASLYPTKVVPSLAAGLPHFASDWARCWGRDIMIAMRGLLICTGRHQDAKEHILAFASVVKHGTIPNLLGSGKSPRYNSRDSVWFFLQCIQDYTKIVPDGVDLLKVPVKRRFLPYDDTWFPSDDPHAYSVESTVEDVIQEIMQRHASGLHFREYNAGPNLDSQMTSEGFNIDIEVDPDTGFVFGGNQHNCGTWMDKMGESAKAKNKGIPGTPRDGAAVEITGLLYSTCAWLTRLNASALFSYNSVDWSDGNTLSYQAWAHLIKDNFERCYYIPRFKSDDSKHDIDSAIINRRGIYKDVYRSGKPYEDYQLRPNFAIAMVVAPELFEREHAIHALWMMDRILRGPYGMRTLDPSDLNYRPYYINSDDSDDFLTAKGRNYHQGPEWLWPLGFLLRALLKFGASHLQVTHRLAGCMSMLKTSEWAGLTELTNKDGAFCADSCPSQAWSAGCLIDLFEEAMREEAQDGDE
jgi:glycogen debranching enzyme